MEMDEIKNLWKKQTARGRLSGSGSNPKILDVIYFMEKKTRKKYIIASAALCIDFLFFAFFIFYLDFFTKLSLAGAILIMTAIIMGMVSIWSTCIPFRKTDLITPGIDFLKSVLDKLDRRKFLRIYLIPAYLVMIAFGLSMIFSEHLSMISSFWKAVIYSASYIYIIVIYIVTARKEVRNEKIEIEPLRKKIKELIMQMDSE